ncbi:hypothetical protein PGTUg99_004530 [Puccinia graminis f. sp. tritici]|uniref:Uncharacterized protein n=1 Tax=Puccinia graminis f. sp. tritici TaxID=56615 RepID=A0A5B0PVK8_PUCGR|nr:hypothetical protein PGTUg99_004530 [Puccinia graminis f. sp. tritici]
MEASPKPVNKIRKSNWQSVSVSRRRTSDAKLKASSQGLSSHGWHNLPSGRFAIAHFNAQSSRISVRFPTEPPGLDSPSEKTNWYHRGGN